MKKSLLSVMLSIMSVVAFATDYNSIAMKAQRFYDQQEWASASAMYDLMLAERPDNHHTYSKAIISAAMRSDTLSQVSLMEASMKFHVPFDSIFTTVQRESFAIGEGALYENFMERIKRAKPWLSRNINAYLLRYYTFRCNPSKMIEYSLNMLTGMPEDISFLTTLAKGYMLNDQQQKSIDTYSKILKIKPDDYNSLLELGNYFYLIFQQNDKDDIARQEALNYFQQAETIISTPYVTKVINKLKHTK